MSERSFPPWESGALNLPTLQRLDFNLLSLAEQLEQMDFTCSPCLQVNPLLQTYFFGFHGSSQHLRDFGIQNILSILSLLSHLFWILFHHFSQVPSAKSGEAA